MWREVSAISSHTNLNSYLDNFFVFGGIKHDCINFSYTLWVMGLWLWQIKVAKSAKFLPMNWFIRYKKLLRFLYSYLKLETSKFSNARISVVGNFTFILYELNQPWKLVQNCRAVARHWHANILGFSIQLWTRLHIIRLQ